MITTAVSELMGRLSANLVAGEGTTRISGFAALGDAEAGDLSFFYDLRYRQSLAVTKASAVLVPVGWNTFPPDVACLAVKNPSEAFGELVHAFAPEEEVFEAGIHPSAVIGKLVTGRRDRIRVGPHAVIEDGVHLGDETEIGAGCFLGRGARIGERCKLFANVTVHQGSILGDRVILHTGSVIGAEGFDYRFGNGRHQKVPHHGIVQIDDDVEIGAGCAVDRARIGKTHIGEGTKIDNSVRIAHNVVMGKHCIIVAQCTLGAHAVIGDYVVLAGQAGVAAHVRIGSQCTLGLRTMATKDLPSGSGSYLGYPAQPAGQERRRMVLSRQLPDVFDRLRALEKKSQDKDREP